MIKDCTTKPQMEKKSFKDLPIGTMFAYSDSPKWSKGTCTDKSVYIKVNDNINDNCVKIGFNSFNEPFIYVSHFSLTNFWYFFSVDAEFSVMKLI